jgi:hypothetical protein
MACLGFKRASIIRGGPYSMPASVNVLIEAFAINRGGYFKVPASVNRFCEAVVVTASVNKK